MNIAKTTSKMKPQPLSSFQGDIQILLLTDVRITAHEEEDMVPFFGGILKPIAEQKEGEVEFWIFLQPRNPIRRVIFQIQLEALEISPDTKSQKQKMAQLQQQFEQAAIQEAAYRASIVRGVKQWANENVLAAEFDANKQIRLLNSEISFVDAMKEAGWEMMTKSFLEAPDDAGAVRWIQDPLFLLEEAGKGVLLDSMYPWEWERSGGDDDNGVVDTADPYTIEIPNQIAKMSHLTVKPTPFMFQGGNMLAGDDFLLVGTDIIRQNWRMHQAQYPDFASFMDALTQSFHAKWILSPGMPESPTSYRDVPAQPRMFFHLDLFLTLAGKDEDGKHLVFLAECYALNGEEELAPVPVTEPKSPNKYLDDVHRWLTEYCFGPAEQIQFRVVRIPSYVNKAGRFFPINNCIVEISENGKNIYAPSFLKNKSGFEHVNVHLKYCQDLASERMKAECFEVEWLDFHFYNHAGLKGSLHCLTKVLERRT